MIEWMKSRINAAISKAGEERLERDKLVAKHGAGFVLELERELAHVNASRINRIERLTFMNYVRRFGDDVALAGFFCRQYPQQGDDILTTLVNQAAQVAWIRQRYEERLAEDRRGLDPPSSRARTPEVDR